VVITMVVGLLSGVQVMTARAVGERRRHEAGAVLRRGVVYAFWIGLASTAALMLVGPAFLHAIGLSQDLADGATRPLLVFALSLLPYSVSVAASFWLEGLSRPGAAVWAMWIANGVNLAIQIRAHVNSAEFRAARYRAAGALLAGQYTSHVVYVLDEMETVGLLIEKGALDREIIWTMLSALVINYVAAARIFIEADRQRNPTMWANLLSLEHHMLEVERSQGGTDLDASDTFRAYLKTELHEMSPTPDAAVTSAATGDPPSGKA